MRLYQLVLLLVSFAILVILILSANPVRVLDIIKQGDMNFVLLGFVVASCSVCVLVLKWNVLIPAVRFWDLAPIQLLGTTISNFTPGKVGEPLKAVFLKMKSGHPVAHALSSIIWERISDIIVLLLFSTAAFSLLDARLEMLSIAGIMIFSVLALVLLVVLYKQTFGKKLFAFLKKFPFVNKISDTFIDSFYAARISKKNIILSFFLTLVTWVLDGFVFYLALRAVGIHVSPILVIGMFSLSVIIGIASTLPGGIGTLEFALAVLYGLAGIPSDVAITAVVLGRFMSFWFDSFLGGISFLWLSKTVNLRQAFGGQVG